MYLGAIVKIIKGTGKIIKHISDRYTICVRLRLNSISKGGVYSANIQPNKHAGTILFLKYLTTTPLAPIVIATISAMKLRISPCSITSPTNSKHTCYSNSYYNPSKECWLFFKKILKRRSKDWGSATITKVLATEVYCIA